MFLVNFTLLEMNTIASTMGSRKGVRGEANHVEGEAARGERLPEESVWELGITLRVSRLLEDSHPNA